VSSIPDFTERQATAWPEAIARLVAAGATVPESPHRWAIAYSEETRAGRGHFIDATYVDGEQFAQIQMDVYGYPSTSLAVLTWVHADADEECGCEPCEAERAAEDEDCIGAVARLVAVTAERPGGAA